MLTSHPTSDVLHVSALRAGRLGLASAVMLTLGLVACGSSATPTNAATATPSAANTSPSASAPGGSGASAIFNVSLTLSGAVTGSTTFTATEPDTSCTGTGIGTAGENGVPPPGSSAHPTINGSPLSYSIAMSSPYTGPGTYGTSDFSTSSAAISADSASQSDPFGVTTNPSATETLVFAADGSGSFNFSNWKDVDLQRTLSGSFQWTCQSSTAGTSSSAAPTASASPTAVASASSTAGAAAIAAAKADWVAGAAAISADQAHYWSEAVTSLTPVATPGTDAGAAVTDLQQLISLPETSETSEQQAEAHSDVAFLNIYFGTSGLYS
jgi:hypothetical protein